MAVGAAELEGVVVPPSALVFVLVFVFVFVLVLLLVLVFVLACVPAHELVRRWLVPARAHPRAWGRGLPDPVVLPTPPTPAAEGFRGEHWCPATSVDRPHRHYAV